MGWMDVLKLTLREMAVEPPAQQPWLLYKSLIYLKACTSENKSANLDIHFLAYFNGPRHNIYGECIVEASRGVY